MIGRMSGILLEKQPVQVVLDVGGIGYEVDVSMQTFYTLPAAGEAVSLFIQQVIREDAHLLFGFASRSEREAFRKLLKVSGIGAKTALGILSAMNEEELALAVANEDLKRISSVPGIGKKTAERLVLELRGKLVVSSDTGVANGEKAVQVVPSSAQNDIAEALLSLGYSEREIRTALKNLPFEVTVSDGLRQALKILST